MVMLRADSKATAIAKKVLKNKGVKIPKTNSMEKLKAKGPYLQH